MKPKNFPGRKNDRRKAAQAQLFGAENTRANRLDRPPGFNRAAEINRLSKLIVSDEAARAIRTKKDRSTRARIRA
jgi:hypothetical protein